MSFSAVSAPYSLPGKCYSCGGIDKEKYLDTGIQIEFYGALYFCIECFNEQANLFGYISPVLANQLKAENQQLLLAKAELEVKVMALEQAINSLKVAGFSDSSSIKLDDEFPVPDVPVLEASEQIAEPPRRREIVMEIRKREPVESSDDEDLDGLRSSKFSFDL